MQHTFDSLISPSLIAFFCDFKAIISGFAAPLLVGVHGRGDCFLVYDFILAQHDILSSTGGVAAQ